ncbi:serine/threonine protein kinase [bacterium]|nr:serine/threonine protein kinase [bacterium]
MVARWMLVVLLTVPALAKKEAMLVHTDPSGAYVYMVVHGKPASQNNPAQAFAPADYKLPPGDLLGPADSGPLVTRDLPAEQTETTLILLHKYCQPEVIRVDLKAWRSGGGNALPQGGGAYKLHYLNRTAAWRDFMARRGPLLLLLGLTATGLAFTVPTYLDRLRQREEAARAAARKASLLTGLVVPSANQDPLIGTLLDNYRILQLIGLGGMARVYRAVPDETLDEKQAVAIKIMNAEMGNNPELVHRFNFERKVYEELNHPHIVKVVISGEQSGHYYMVMELIRGQSLRAEINQEGIPPKKMLRLMKPIFEAVHYAHQKGVVHRDLKPENVMQTQDGQIKVMDFGLARATDASKVTATGTVLGTPAYMSPEQINNLPHPASDQYSLGVMCWEMLTGRRPFEDENPVTLIVKHLSEPVPSLARLRPDLEKFAKVLERMLAKKPEERYRDLDLALKALEHLV